MPTRALAPASLQHLKANELSHLASLCGLSKTGTKPALTARLTSALDPQTFTPLPTTARILSIDLGVRNLAYSLISPPSPSPAPAKLLAWRRFALAAPDADFAPEHLAPAAVRLVRGALLPLRPTHVLLERQRFRSGGGAGVFEWTLRVGALEAMVHALLADLRGAGAWAGGEVVSVAPARVVGFMVRGGGEDGVGGGGVKRAKVGLVARLLGEGREVGWRGGEADAVVRAFLYAALPRSERKGKPAKNQTDPALEESGGYPPKKIDDLADSLLQAVAWLRWEANKKTLLEGGPGELLTRYPPAKK